MTETCELLTWTKTTQGVTSAAETVPAFSVYVSYANFAGQDPTNQHPIIYVAVVERLRENLRQADQDHERHLADQGSSLAIDPLTGQSI